MQSMRLSRIVNCTAAVRIFSIDMCFSQRLLVEWQPQGCMMICKLSFVHSDLCGLYRDLWYEYQNVTFLDCELYSKCHTKKDSRWTGSEGVLNRCTVFEPVHEHAARPNGCLGWFMHVYGHVSKLTPVHTPSFNIVSVLVRFRCMNRFRIGVAIPPWTGPESATNCTHGEPVHGFEPVQTPPRQILAIAIATVSAAGSLITGYSKQAN